MLEKCVPTYHVAELGRDLTVYTQTVIFVLQLIDYFSTHPIYIFVNNTVESAMKLLILWHPLFVEKFGISESMVALFM